MTKIDTNDLISDSLIYLIYSSNNLRLYAKGNPNSERTIRVLEITFNVLDEYEQRYNSLLELFGTE